MNVSTAVTAEQSLRLLLSIMDAIIIILLVNQSPLSFRLVIISIDHGCDYYYFVGESITIIIQISHH